MYPLIKGLNQARILPRFHDNRKMDEILINIFLTQLNLDWYQVLFGLLWIKSMTSHARSCAWDICTINEDKHYNIFYP